MPLHDDLLKLAKELVDRNPAAPVEADLRRGVSTAYYALFHLLVHDQVQAQTDVQRAESAFASWVAVQAEPATQTFITELLCRGIPKR